MQLGRLCLVLALVASAHALAADQGEGAKAPAVYISVAGAPGDGEEALAAALSRRLEALGIRQATAFEAEVYDIQGTVRVSPASRGKETVTIVWVVLAPDGNQLGVTKQTKDVKKGSLGKKWGGAAEAAVSAAASDIAQLIPH